MCAECGGEIQDVGGSIYMNNVTGYYDCVWIIKPPLSVAYLKTHIYLKVTFTGSGTFLYSRRIACELLMNTYMCFN